MRLPAPAGCYAVQRSFDRFGRISGLGLRVWHFPLRVAGSLLSFGVGGTGCSATSSSSATSRGSCRRPLLLRPLHGRGSSATSCLSATSRAVLLDDLFSFGHFEGAGAFGDLFSFGHFSAVPALAMPCCLPAPRLLEARTGFTQAKVASRPRFLLFGGLHWVCVDGGQASPLCARVLSCFPLPRHVSS